MEPPQAGQREASFKTTFGRVLRELRLERELSQEALAEAAGCHVNHVSYLERGLRSPNLLVVFDLARALQLSTAELVDRVEASLRQPNADDPVPPSPASPQRVRRRRQ